jgi:type IV pilus assembly protein PilM
MNFFKTNVLGVDLGTRTLKGVKLKPSTSGKVKLVNLFFHDLSLTSTQFPECDRAEAFKAAIETQGLSHSQTASAVRDSEVMSFTLNLPKMSAKELAQVVPEEIAEQAHIEIEEHSIDFLVTEDKKDSDTTTVKAFCVKRDVVLEQMHQLKAASLKPKTIESEMMALKTMLEFNGYIDPKEVSVVIDLGEVNMASGLISEGALALTKSDSHSFGGVNRVLQKEFKLSYDQAEKIKLEFDFLVGPGNEPTAIMEAVENQFVDVFNSIKQALEFYKECPESFSRIDKVFLIGGGSQVKSVVQTIEQFFKVPTQIVNPFRNIDIFSEFDEKSSEDFAKLAPFMGTAVGLALASISDGKVA